MKKLVILSFSVLLLALSVFVVNAATTFQGPPAGCTSAEDPNCNLDGVIWNRSTSDPAQTASFNITGNTRTGGSARVGNGLQVDSGDARVAGEVFGNYGNTSKEIRFNNEGDLVIKDSKALRVDLDNSSSTLYIGNYGAGDHPVNVNIQGTFSVSKDQILGWSGTPNVTAPQFCLNGDCITSWPTAGGGGTIDGSGTANKIAKFSDSNTLTNSSLSDDGTSVVIDQTTAAGSPLTVRRSWNSNEGDPAYGNTVSGGAALVVDNNVDNGMAEPNVGSIFSAQHMGVERVQIANNGFLNIRDGGALCFTGGYCIDKNTDLGDITNVTAGNGLTGGASEGSATLNVGAGTGISVAADTVSISDLYRLPQSGCSTGYAVKWNGSGWGCAPDNDTISSGDITNVSVTSPIGGGGASGSVSIGLNHPSTSDPSDYIWKSYCTALSGSSCISRAWTASVLNNGDITGVTAGSGLSGGGISGNVTLSVAPAGAWGSLQFNNSGSLGASNALFWDNSNWRLGIGTQVPSYPLDVSGQINLNKGIGYGAVALRVNSAEALWYDGSRFSWGYGGSENYFADRVYINYTADAGPSTYGGLTIGDIGGQHLKFDGNEIFARNGGSSSILYLQQDGGAVYVNGGSVHASDKRLKKNIKNLKYGLHDLLKLNPVTFEWNYDTNNETNLGFIAQEVQPIMPESVKYDLETEKYYLNYNDFIPVIVNSVQEQQEMITNLKSQNDELRTQNEYLENRLERLESILRYVK